MTIHSALRALVIALALVCASCATKEPAAGRDGSSMETAIILESITNEVDGVHAEHAETNKRFPGWQWQMQGLLPGADGRHYDVITLSKGAETKDVYFDITDWFGKL
jgi:hypothetical protein